MSISALVGLLHDCKDLLERAFDHLMLKPLGELNDANARGISL